MALMQSVDQLLVVELHAVGGLVLDAVPQRLELLAVQHGLPGLAPVLRSSAFLISSLPGQLAENFLHLRELSRERLRQRAACRP